MSERWRIVRVDALLAHSLRLSTHLAPQVDSFAMGCIASKGVVKTSHQVDNIWDVFTRIKLLGRGASGEVWQVKDKKGQMFALKKLDKADPQNESMFEHECNILERLDHPNILKFNDCYEVHRVFVSNFLATR